MAFGAVEKKVKGVRTAEVRAGTGKLRGRHCVVTDADRPSPGFRGKGSKKRMFGCFREKSAAIARAEQLARRTSLK